MVHKEGEAKVTANEPAERWWAPALERSQAEFMYQFEQWATKYDETVWHQKGKYAEVFAGYGAILQRVADLVQKPAGSLVVDIGMGTGNLALELIERQYRVIGVDPVETMLAQARRKLPGIDARLGHFLQLPLADATADAIVSTYAFHHLNERERFAGIAEMLRVLKPDGRLVIADMIFLSDEVRRRLYHRLGAAGRSDFVAELEAEPYTTVLTLEDLFGRAGCVTRWEQLTSWVWIVEARRTTHELTW